MTELSVIIPALNEAATLPLLLEDLRAQSDCEIQIIVADSWSGDATAEVAEKYATVVQANRGRGAQMNSGVAKATGEFLLFVHADSRLENPRMLRDALDALKAERVRAGTHKVAGHFALKFDRQSPEHEEIFGRMEAKSALNRPDTINGDQGFLLGTDYWNELGGFDERLPFLEDQRMAARIFETGRWILLPHGLRTSARRFETEGVRERLALMALLMGAYKAEFDKFLHSAPDIYADQDRATRLQLAPFYQRARRTLRSLGWRGMAGTLFRAGRYVRNNCWQLFWWRDYRRNAERSATIHPTLDFFDRHVAKLINNHFFDALGTALVTAWLFAWLPLTENRGK